MLYLPCEWGNPLVIGVIMDSGYLISKPQYPLYRDLSSKASSASLVVAAVPGVSPSANRRSVARGIVIVSPAGNAGLAVPVMSGSAATAVVAAASPMWV